MADRAPPPRWTHSDDPAVRQAADGEPACVDCGAWSQWLGSTGDCLLHFYRRRDAIIAGELTREEREWRFPARAARMTRERETCDGLKEISCG